MEEDGGSEMGERRVANAATFRLGQHVCISKEKIRFAKAAEQNFSTDIFRVAKVIERRPQVVLQLENVNGTPLDCELFREEMTPVRITDRTAYEINKFLDKRVRRGIREYIVRWRVYIQDIVS